MSRPPLLILGASARAAAQSAVRAGFAPFGIDLFCDIDLRAVAGWRKVDGSDYPEGLESLAAAAPPGPWIYTGALENHPDLVGRIAQARPLWGAGPSALRAARDPIHLARALRDAGLPALGVRLDPLGLPLDGSWLRKPIRSAGGRSIRPLTRDLPPASFPAYYQRRVEGECRSAQFLAETGGRSAELLGILSQWVGGPRSPFAYRGGLGPIAVSARERADLRRIGEVLAAATGVSGLFGVDYISNYTSVWPLELNPRSTAATEILELAEGRSLLAEHARRFDAEPAGPRPPPPVTRPSVVGKAILHAPIDRDAGSYRFLKIDEFLKVDDLINRDDCWAVPDLADLPAADAKIAPGAPVLTVFAQGRDPDECARRLAERSAEWQDRLFGRDPKPIPAMALGGRSDR